RADALVVVGAEAGGHPPPAMVTTQVLVRAVARAIPDIALIASGGVADGAGRAAMLALGAGAAQFGTRFLASTEATVHDAYKRAVLGAGVDATRTVGHGPGIIRALGNDFTARMLELEADGADETLRRKVFQESTLKDAALYGDVAEGRVEAGQSAGLVDEVLPAAEIVARIVHEYRAVRTGLPPVLEA
ncbi:nitronate monooxygenase, partial [Nocardia sp. NPDC004568]|uniref:NAD(P)H-dependent flavin oxidoreductase n=1 Tax=Nocardia sp. NPDC004568 TaxID=3154551 RepID=UPI0033BF1BF8